MTQNDLNLQECRRIIQSQQVHDDEDGSTANNTDDDRDDDFSGDDGDISTQLIPSRRTISILSQSLLTDGAASSPPHPLHTPDGTPHRRQLPATRRARHISSSSSSCEYIY